MIVTITRWRNGVKARTLTTTGERQRWEWLWSFWTQLFPDSLITITLTP